MKFVSEKIIDSIVEELEGLQNFEKEIAVLRSRQPIAFSYLLSENFDVLTKDEKEYLIYLGLVILKSAEKVDTELIQIEEEELGGAEERNYELMQESKSVPFREKLNIFFKGYDQEDLLAFVEDALAIGEEEEEEFFQVTPEGREPIFIAAKSIIDCL